MRPAFILCAALCCLIGWSAAAHPRMISKQLAGPPTEFNSMKLPHPEEAAVTEHSSVIWIDFDRTVVTSDGSHKTTIEMPVDSSVLFAFSVYSPMEDKMTLRLLNPNNEVVDTTPFATKSFYPIGSEKIPGTYYLFQGGNVMRGVWTLECSIATSFLSASKTIGDGLVILFNEDAVEITSHLSSYNLQFHDQIGLVTKVVDNNGNLLASLPGASVQAKIEVVLPDGAEKTVDMHDDGLHADFFANDGIFGATFEADEMGMYLADAIVTGTLPDGTAFRRSTQHMIPVVDREVTLTGHANVVKNANHAGRLDIQLEITTDAKYSTLDGHYRPYAEVYATNDKNEEVSVCWLSSMQKPKEVNGRKVLVLELDEKWLQLAGAKGPLTLKNVFIQESKFYTPLSQADVINVKMDAEAATMLHSVQPAQFEITKEMRRGVLPESLRNVTKRAGKPTQMMLHGYCSNGQVWQSYNWDSPAFYIDENANKLNDEFAEGVVAYADSLGMEGWTIIGHSQGGVVGLYLLNYFFTGMDAVSEGRLVQSVGTPYKGCSGAGTAANLIAMFGAGCGSNFDLTTDGSNLFLKGIDAETRKNVYYYTTTYEQGKFFGDYCNGLVNFVLEWPNDGVSEYKYSNLEGGNFMGNKEKWCHTTDMAYEAQYLDASRNAEMNKASF